MKKKYAQFLLDKTKKDYNLIAEDFSRTREGIWEEIRFLFDDYLKENDKVLDIGCGNGRCLALMKEKNIDYFGIDNSQRLINIAKQKYPEHNFFAADGLVLPFDDNYFDKVYSIAVFHHIPSKHFRIKFLSEIKRVLKPKSIAILTVWKFHQKKEVLLLLKYTLLKLLGLSNLDFGDIFEPWGNKINRYYHWFTKKELLKLAKKAGFKIKKIGVVKNEKGNRRNIFIVVEK